MDVVGHSLEAEVVAAEVAVDVRATQEADTQQQIHLRQIRLEPLPISRIVLFPAMPP